MADFKSHFSMTRHERRGMLAVLVFIAITLLVLWAVSSYAPSPSATDRAALERFQAEADSARRAATDTSAAKQHSKRKGKRAGNDGKKGKDSKKGNDGKKGGKRGKPAKKPTTPSPGSLPVPNY